MDGFAAAGLRCCAAIGDAARSSLRPPTKQQSKFDKRQVDDAIERCGPYGRFQWFALFFAGVSWLCDALEVMLLSFLGPAVECEWSLSAASMGALTSVVFAGMTVGGPLWGCVSDGFGRRTAFACSVLCTTVFGFLSAAARSYTQLLAFRFFVGLGIPGACVSFALLMEFVPAQTRGLYLIAIEGFWTIGTIAQAGLAYALLNDRGWRSLVVASAAPLVLQLALLPLVPESPRYLQVKGKTAAAERALGRVLKFCGKQPPPGRLRPLKEKNVDGDGGARPGASASALASAAPPPPPPDMPPLRRLATALGNGARDIAASVRALFSPELRLVTLSLCFIWFVAAFTYYGIVARIATVPFVGGGQKECVVPGGGVGGGGVGGGVGGGGANSTPRMIFPKDDLLAILVTSVAEIPGLVLSLLLAQYLSRKHAFAIPMACIAVVLVPLLPRTLPRGGVIACLWLSRFFVYAAFNLLWAITPELFPTSCRSFALGITNAISRIGGLVSPFAAVVAPREAWPSSAELIFAVAALAAAAAIYAIPRDMNHRRVSDTVEDVRAMSETERADRAASRLAGKAGRDDRREGLGTAVLRRGGGGGGGGSGIGGGSGAAATALATV